MENKIAAHNIKQLDIHVRYWSLMENKIAARHLNSCFLGHATADIMKNNIVKCLTDDRLSLAKMIMLSSDGPNTNKSVKNKFANAQKALGCPSLVDIGSCNLPTIHNAFKQECHIGVLKNFLLTSSIIVKIFHPVQRIVMKFVLLSIITINLGVDSRWLSISPVTAYVLENWECLCQYFLHRKFDSQMKENSRFKKICV